MTELEESLSAGNALCALKFGTLKLDMVIASRDMRSSILYLRIGWA
jgi:hypothetical protein